MQKGLRAGQQTRSNSELLGGMATATTAAWARIDNLRTLAVHCQLGSFKADSMLSAWPVAACLAILQKLACTVSHSGGAQVSLLLCCYAGRQPPTSLRSRVMSGRLCTIMVALCQPEGFFQRRSRTLSDMCLKVMLHTNFVCVKSSIVLMSCV